MKIKLKEDVDITSWDRNFIKENEENDGIWEIVGEWKDEYRIYLKYGKWTGSIGKEYWNVLPEYEMELDMRLFEI